jgi:hypothetical protein
VSAPGALPPVVAALLERSPVVGTKAQAFPLLTVDDGGAVHACLLSASELAVGDDGVLLAAIASTGTRRRLALTGRATLLAIEGTTAHSCRLSVRRTAEIEAILGVELALDSHTPDSLGIALWPLSYDVTPELATLEQWERSARVLAQLGARRMHQS